MSIDHHIPSLSDCVDLESFRVYAASTVLFLCGGRVDVTVATPVSLRDAFLKISDRKPFKKYDVLMAEDLNPFFPDGKYQDILSLEADLAQISELIVVFSESYGSAAELGAFAMDEEIAKRMLVVIDDKNYSIDSFIKLGPIKRLENNYKECAVCVLNREDLKVISIKNLSGLDFDVFSNIISEAFSARAEIDKEHTTFNKNRDGHRIKLIVGIIQHYGALMLSEIRSSLHSLGVEVEEFRLEQYLMCAAAVKWIIKEKRGVRIYFCAIVEKSAVKFELKESSEIRDKSRWRASIRDYWKDNDPTRFSCIQFAIGKMPT